MSPPSPEPAAPAAEAQDPRLRVPGARDVPITTALIAINIGFFALEELWGNSESLATLVRMGAVYRADPAYFHWGSLLSYGYLHIGGIHLGVNMFALWNMGRSLEPLLRGARFFVLYTLSLLGGGIAIALSPTPRVTAGASGALFGLLGAISVIMYRRYQSSLFPGERREIRGAIGGMLLPNLIISLLPGVSLLGHAGGLIVGAAFVAPTFFKPAKSVRNVLATPGKGMSFAAVILVLFTIAAVASVWLAFQPWRSLPGALGLL